MNYRIRITLASCLLAPLLLGSDAPRQGAAPRAAAGAVSTTGADGIPVFAPIVISNPGRYVLVRNISGPGTVIDIETGGVEVDLNGFTVESTTDEVATVEIFPTPPAIQLEDVTVRDGSIRGGAACLFADRVTKLTLSGIRAGGCPTGISVDDVEAALIERNQIAVDEFGLLVDNCDACRVSDNSLRGGVQLGLRVLFARGGEITGNRVVDSVKCFEIGGNGPLVRGNVASNCSDGMVVQAINASITDNVLSSSGVGLRFSVASSSNVYRGNTARGSGTDFIDEGVGNTSAGDNYLPDLR